MGEDGPAPEDLFAGFPESLRLYAVVERAVREAGEVSARVGRSQVAFRRRRGFAYAWRPGQYVASPVPLVLSIALSHELGSPRFKQVVQPSAGRWMHHLELRAADDVDAEVRGWLREAYAEAG